MPGEKIQQRSIAIVGAGVFGLSLAVSLSKRGFKVTVFDQHKYDDLKYAPGNMNVQAASVDHNKIFRASYGTKTHYQRLAMESHESWRQINEAIDNCPTDTGLGVALGLFNGCGMLRVQPTDQIGELEKETLANMERHGFRDKQFIRSNKDDMERARQLGWDAKLLRFRVPDSNPPKDFEAVLDSTAGFIRCSDACYYYYKLAVSLGTQFKFGPSTGAFESLIEESLEGSDEKKAIGIQTRDGIVHKADTIVIAAGSFSTQILPELATHLESSAGSVVTFKIDKNAKDTWEKYAPENFPVITWKSLPRGKNGRDMGSVYVFPRTPEGLVKIGYRGVKYTNFVPAPADAPFSQDGLWSVPLSPHHSSKIPEQAQQAIKNFVRIFLPEFDGVDFFTTKLCWYTDSLDNSFVIDYVPSYFGDSVFVCTGGSGHGAKFLPVLGEHAADILENGKNSSSYMQEHWRWRDEMRRGNGLQEGPEGPRNIVNCG